MVALSKEQRFNRAFNYFLVIGLTLAVTVSTIYKFQEPNARVFILLLAAFSSIMGVLSTVLSANGNIMTFIFGFLDVLIGTIIYFDNGIMGNFALHAFCILFPADAIHRILAVEQEGSEDEVAWRRSVAGESKEAEWQAGIFINILPAGLDRCHVPDPALC